MTARDADTIALADRIERGLLYLTGDGPLLESEHCLIVAALRANRAATVAPTDCAEIDQLRERCLAYKGQVEAGSIAIQHLQGEIARLRAALKPFAYYYDLNDCQEREKIPANALEVPIADLKAAKMAMTSG